MGTWAKGLDSLESLYGEWGNDWLNDLGTFSSGHRTDFNGSRGSGHRWIGSKTGQEGPDVSGALGRFQSGNFSCL